MNPPMLTTRDVVEGVVTARAKGKTLDIGAGSAKYRATILAGAVTSYETCDIHPGPNVDSVQDIHHLTFADASFDTILCFQVFEHIKDPRKASEEIFRVLKPGGVCIITAPFLSPQHADPSDYQRFTVMGMRELFGRAGFEIVECEAHGAIFTVLAEFVKFMFINPYADKKPGRVKRKLAQKAIDLLLWMDRKRLSKSKDFYANVYLVGKKP
jgi:SAM-dependent methyltransferase